MPRRTVVFGAVHGLVRCAQTGVLAKIGARRGPTRDGKGVERIPLLFAVLQQERNPPPVCSYCIR